LSVLENYLMPVSETCIGTSELSIISVWYASVFSAYEFYLLSTFYRVWGPSPQFRWL